MERNYYLEYKNIIKDIDILNKPKLLLHVCCAPCSSGCLLELVEFFDITIYYYNPNISPLDEYQKRLLESVNFTQKVYPQIKVIDAEYDNNHFEELVKGFESQPEGGSRCKICYKMRLEKTAQYAKDNGFDFFTTTLTISPYKNSKILNEIGENVAKQYGVKYLFSDFKKNDGYKKSIENSKKYGLYRQNYCGCKYSKLAREQYEKLKAEGKIFSKKEDYEG